MNTSPPTSPPCDKPATAALEALMSSSCLALATTAAPKKQSKKRQLNMLELFDAVGSADDNDDNQLPFPSIGWDFGADDDESHHKEEDDETVSSSYSSSNLFVLNLKSSSSSSSIGSHNHGMRRSKVLRTSIASLAAGGPATQHLMMASRNF